MCPHQFLHCTNFRLVRKSYHERRVECQNCNCHPRPPKKWESLIFAEEFLEFLFKRWDSWTASDLGSIVKALDFGRTLTNRFSRAFHRLRIYLCSDWSFAYNLAFTVRWPCCFLLPCYVKKNIAVEMTSSSCYKSFVSFFIHLFCNDIEKYLWPLTDCKCLLSYFLPYFVFLSNVVLNLLFSFEKKVCQLFNIIYELSAMTFLQNYF